MSEYENPDTAEVGIEYEHFFERVEYWQAILDKLDSDSQEFVDQAGRATAEIDDICPYIGEIVMVSGEGDVPVLQVNDNVPTVVDTAQYGSELSGLHHGVQVRKYQGYEDTAPRSQLMHMIEILKVGAWTSNGHELRNSQFAAYFPIKPTVHITKKADMEEIWGQHIEQPVDSAQTWGILVDHSKITRQAVQSDAFMSFSEVQQQNLLRRLVDEAEAAVQLRDRLFSIKSDVGYVPYLSNQELLLMPFSLEDHVIQGTILGVESLASMRLSAGKQIKSVEDIKADDAGLCLVVAPDASVQEQFSLAASQVMYLPIVEDDGELFADLESD